MERVDAEAAVCAQDSAGEGGVPRFSFHDLRHTGNQFAAQSGAALRDLMARMGDDSERAAMIYQHVTHGADQLITNAIDAQV
jgi:integrase